MYPLQCNSCTKSTQNTSVFAVVVGNIFKFHKLVQKQLLQTLISVFMPSLVKIDEGK